ncbi:gp25 [Salmonella enterica subsp. enterica]|nr:gp25 [Salmonella enterica subsp. enterica] [Salmonella enterica subsp. enterica serovar Sundsvall]
MMLALGMFVFERRTLPYQSMQHSKDYRWASNDRVGKPPAYQFSARGRTRSSLPVRFTLILPAVAYPCWLLN